MIGKQGGKASAPTGATVIQPKKNGGGVVGGGMVSTGTQPKGVKGNNNKLK
jgi:hypothetical protein